MQGLRGLGGRLRHNAVRVVRRITARSVLGKAAARDRFWLLVRVGPRISEQRASAFPFSREPGPVALVDVLRALEVAAEDPRVAGVVLRFESGEGGLSGFASAAALRRAVLRLRQAGKVVWAWGESFDILAYSVACAASRVELPPSGSLQLVGLRSQQWFARELLDRVGVRAEVVRIGSSKTAAEPLVRRGMSSEQREQVDAFQAEVFDELVGAIAEGRGLDEASVRKHIDEGPYAAEAALERGLLDACRYPDEVEAALCAALESQADAGSDDGAGGAEPPLVEASTYFALHAGDAGWRPLGRDLPRLAYVVASGSIHRGRASRGIASLRYAELFARLMRDDELAGVVLRIDSPGGDAVASDLLHRAVERLALRKPVVVTMGEVAASGGYYLAAGAHRVFAERSSLTGSIGVIGGKLDLSGLYERLGLDTDAVERGARAGISSETRGFTPDERSALQREMRALYATFKDRVAKGRSLEPAAVENAAQGRIWSGERARTLGLVDALGGPLEALAEVCDRAGIARGQRVLVDVHPRRARFAGMRNWLGALHLRGRAARNHFD